MFFFPFSERTLSSPVLLLSFQKAVFVLWLLKEIKHREGEKKLLTVYPEDFRRDESCLSPNDAERSKVNQPSADIKTHQRPPMCCVLLFGSFSSLSLLAFRLSVGSSLTPSLEVS